MANQKPIAIREIESKILERTAYARLLNAQAESLELETQRVREYRQLNQGYQTLDPNSIKNLQ